MPAKRSPDPGPVIPNLSLPHLLEHQAKHTPDALAILAPGRAPLSYHRLYQHIDEMGRVLRSMGIGRYDRIALVLPNGPEMAVAILAVTTIATCAPMNPAYGAEEVDRCFADLGPRTLITEAGIDSPARRVALARGIPIVELSTALEAEASLFALTGSQAVPSSHESVSPGAWALLLSYPFPGNMRQLRHVLRLAGCTAEDGIIVETDLDLPPFGGRLAEPDHAAAERTAIVKALRAHAGRVTDAARALKLSRATLYRKIKFLKHSGAGGAAQAHI